MSTAPVFVHYERPPIPEWRLKEMDDLNDSRDFEAMKKSLLANNPEYAANKRNLANTLDTRILFLSAKEEAILDILGLLRKQLKNTATEHDTALKLLRGLDDPLSVENIVYPDDLPPVEARNIGEM